jgi:alpha-ketoglutarate-dependent taurine dioxygenase
MSDKEYADSLLNRFKTVKRSPLRLSEETLIKKSYLDAEEGFPLVIQPNVDNVNLVMWAKSNRELIETELLQHGAILFRDFDVGDSVPRFEQFARAISPDLLDYRERAAPRTEVRKGVYTSTEYPADQYIPLHHEMSYSHNWPTKIWFFCVQPAQRGGRTLIANDRKVFTLLDPNIKARFTQKRVMYVRNYGYGVDLPWQEVFQTTERRVVEEYCRRANTEVEWRDADRLRTRQVRQAIATHPKLGVTVWFNHAHMFHVSNLEPAVRDALLAEFREDELPRNAFYGDGSSIETSVLDEVRETYRRAAVGFPWQTGDILMLDNFLSSHGREPFTGPRKILVTMAELFTNSEQERIR